MRRFTTWKYLLKTNDLQGIFPNQLFATWWFRSNSPLNYEVYSIRTQRFRQGNQQIFVWVLFLKFLCNYLPIRRFCIVRVKLLNSVLTTEIFSFEKVHKLSRGVLAEKGRKTSLSYPIEKVIMQYLASCCHVQL